MIYIQIKPTGSKHPYSTVLDDSKLEKLILEKKEENKAAIIKKLCKEFNCSQEEIIHYHVSKDE